MPFGKCWIQRSGRRSSVLPPRNQKGCDMTHAASFHLTYGFYGPIRVGEIDSQASSLLHFGTTIFLGASAGESYRRFSFVRKRRRLSFALFRRTRRASLGSIPDTTYDTTHRMFISSDLQHFLDKNIVCLWHTNCENYYSM